MEVPRFAQVQLARVENHMQKFETNTNIYISFFQIFAGRATRVISTPGDTAMYAHAYIHIYPCKHSKIKIKL
jgi:hypothetical protein